MAPTFISCPGSARTEADADVRSPCSAMPPENDEAAIEIRGNSLATNRRRSLSNVTSTSHTSSTSTTLASDLSSIRTVKTTIADSLPSKTEHPGQFDTTIETFGKTPSERRVDLWIIIAILVSCLLCSVINCVLWRVELRRKRRQEKREQQRYNIKITTAPILSSLTARRTTQTGTSTAQR